MSECDRSSLKQEQGVCACPFDTVNTEIGSLRPLRTLKPEVCVIATRHYYTLYYITTYVYINHKYVTSGPPTKIGIALGWFRC